MQLTAKGYLHALMVVLLTMCLQKTKAEHVQNITLELKNAPIQKAFEEITRQTGTLLLYTEELLKDAVPVTISIRNALLKDALDACLRHQPLAWKAVNETIVITKKEIPKPLTDSTKIIRGNVSAHGSPLGGVSVTIKGTPKGTISASDGNFQLANVKVPAVLVFSSIGFETMEAVADGMRPVNVSMDISTNQLDDAVIIGYGTTTKRINTGSVAKVSNEEIEKQPVSNALQAISGRIPGLSITQNTGLPGGDFKIQLRGQNSIRPEGNELLYIVDGVPFPSTSLHNNFETANGSIHPLNSISPQDIQSIEVLKDADATAIYGSRGANGVILITTKKGKKGAQSVQFNFYTGIGKIARKMKMLNTPQYLAMRKEAFANDSMMPNPSFHFDVTQWDSVNTTDWQKQVIGGTARQTNAGVSYAGGSANTQFLFATNYYRETTVLAGDFYDEKKSVLLNISHQAFNDKLQLEFSANYLKQHAQLFRRDVTGYALNLPPNAPDLFNEDSNKVLFQPGVNLNPYELLVRPYQLQTSNLVTSGNIKYMITRDIEFATSLGYTKMMLDEISKATLAAQNTVRFPSATASINVGTGSAETWIAEPQIKWQHKFGGHVVSVMTGLTFQESVRLAKSIRGNGYKSDDLLDNLLGAATVTIDADNYTKYRYNSSYSRISWIGNDRYLLNLTARTDASSRFGPGKRVGNFGAIGAGWIFSREHTVQHAIPFLSYGKIRASYGITGNDQIGDYGYVAQWTPTRAVYGNVSGLYPYNLKNDQFSWESNRKLEFAIETGWLKDRITATVARYRNRCSNQLVGYVLPGTTGFESIQDNFPATVENSGWEAEAAALIVNSNNWSWNVSGNITFPKTKLIAFPDLESSSYAHDFRVGHSLFETYFYHFTGLDPQTGMYTVQDINKDGNITASDDRIYTKEIAQKYYGAVSTSIRFKKIQLECLFQFVKHTGYNYLSVFPQPGLFGNQPIEVLSHWRAPGDVTVLPMYTQNTGSAAYTAFANAAESSDASISDASFIRLKNISLSYSLTKPAVKNLTIFCRAQNLLTITKYRGLDPENTNINRLPPLKVIVAGVQVQL